MLYGDLVTWEGTEGRCYGIIKDYQDLGVDFDDYPLPYQVFVQPLNESFEDCWVVPVPVWMLSLISPHDLPENFQLTPDAVENICQYYSKNACCEFLHYDLEFLGLDGLPCVLICCKTKPLSYIMQQHYDDGKVYSRKGCRGRYGSVCRW